MVRNIGLVFCLLVVFCTSSCIKELELNDDAIRIYPFVDGGIRIGTSDQTFKIGRTAGNGIRLQELPGAIVEVQDLTSNERAVFSRCGEATYCGTLAGVFGHEYKLTVEASGFGSFESEPELLEEVNIDIEAEALLDSRLDRDGNEITRRFAKAELSIDIDYPLGSERGALLLKPFYSWSYTDEVCFGLDLSRVCYLLDEYEEPWKFVDLSLQEVGSTLNVSSGNIFVDYRFAEASVISVEVTRISTKAVPYFQQLSTSLNQSGDLFAETPITTTGNILSETNGFPMLGYFSVAMRDTISVLATSNEIKAVSGPRLCRISFFARPEGFDCCECLATPGASGLRPSFWP